MYLDENMILKELIRERFEVFSLTETARLSQAAALMQDKRVGSVVIVDETKTVVGIVPDREIAMTLALGAGTPDSFVSGAMCREVATVQKFMSLFDVSRFFRTIDFKRLPVVDQDDRQVGIVSVFDVMAQLAREMYDRCTSLEP